MAYNEVETLAAVVDELEQAMQNHCSEYEIIVIDDGSTDGTAEIADQLAATRRCCRVIHHPFNKGMGGVYRTGFKQATKDMVYFMAADGQSIPGQYLPQFLQLLETNDVVLGQLVRRQDPLLSKVFSWGEKLLFQIMFPGVPKPGGASMFRRAILEQVQLHCMQDEDRSWIVLWELMVRARQNGFRIAACDTHRRKRIHGVSKGNTWANAFGMLRGAFRLKWILIRHPGTRIAE